MAEVVTAKIAALTLALFMSLSQFFSDGTQAFKDKDYKGAVDAFTKVIDAEVEGNPLLDAALLWRAEAFLALDEKPAATEDLERLLSDNPDGPLTAVARERYKVVTGKDWDGVDLSTPERAWASFMRAVMARDLDATAAACTGEIKEELIEELQDDPDQWDDAVEEIGGYRLASVTYSKSKKMAMIMINKGNRDNGERLIMTQEGGQWRLDREYHSRDADEFEETPAGALGIDLERARQLLLAMQMFHADHNNAWPSKLEALGDYVGNNDDLFKSAATGEPFVLAFAGKTGVPWLFTSKAVNGTRIYGIGGSSQAGNLSEEEFTKLALAAGVKLATEVPVVELTDEETKLIKGMIAKLGAPGYKERREAREALEALGDKAVPLLMEARDAPDPEVAAQIQKLLDLRGN